MIEILKKGMLSTIQDGGRFGYQAMGVSVCGAMDIYALSIANALCGNELHDAAIEITGLGPDIGFLSGNYFAIGGAAFEATLDGKKIEPNKAYFAKKGSVLKIGAPLMGFRGYIAFAGGLDIPVVMGSRSTCLVSGFGGFKGRALEKGDVVHFCNPQSYLPSENSRFCQYKIEPEPRLRVIIGPQEDRFTQEGMATFLSAKYEITPQSNRMGCRTKGRLIEYSRGGGSNIISDGIASGAVQVPDGTPIIMMADRQTAGGYAKIAHVISADMPALGQMAPGGKISFEQIDIDSARKIHRNNMRKIKNLALELDYSPLSRG